MTGLYAFLIVLAALVLIFLWALSRDAALDRGNAICEAARRLNIKCRTGWIFSQTSADGIVDGFRLRILVFQRQDESRWETITHITIENRLPPGLTVTARKRERGSEHQVFDWIGDEVFDGAVDVQARDEVEVIARLDSAGRAAVAGAVRWGAVINNGTLRYQTNVPFQYSEDLVVHCEFLLAAAKALVAPIGFAPARLQHNAATDPVAGVRARCLELLLARFGKSSHAAEAVDTALGDESPDVRIRAAKAAGERGLPVALAIAADSDSDRATRIRAVHLLGELGATADAVPPVLDAILHENKAGDLLIAALQACRSIEYWPPLDVLEGFLGRRNIALRTEVAKQLGRYALPRVESLLLGMLDTDDGPALLAAVRSLSRQGTRVAVEPLQSLAERLLKHSDLRSEVERAIRDIQARIGPVDPGGLSLVQIGDAGGALSIAAEPGSLSEVELDETVENEG